MKKIIVAGGSGFIGTNLCDYLSNDNHVICIDNFSSSSDKNISHLKNKKNFQFINHNICESLDIKVDQIYNLACPASPKRYQNLPLETIQACIDGSRSLLDLAIQNNAVILQASTSEIYGDPIVHPQDEQYFGNVNLNGPRSCYDEGKRMAETIFYNYKNLFAADVRVARIFNTFGPYMEVDDGRVISNFINQSLLGKNITIYGDGKQTRSFCYIDDMILGLTSLMNSDFSKPINIGNVKERSILSTAEMIIELTNSKSQIIFKSLPENDPLQRRPDIKLAEEKINFKPKVPFEVGLEKTILYFERLMS